MSPIISLTKCHPSSLSPNVTHHLSLQMSPIISHFSPHIPCFHCWLEISWHLKPLNIHSTHPLPIITWRKRWGDYEGDICRLNMILYLSLIVTYDLPHKSYLPHHIQIRINWHFPHWSSKQNRTWS